MTARRLDKNGIPVLDLPGNKLPKTCADSQHDWRKLPYRHPEDASTSLWETTWKCDRCGKVEVESEIYE